MTQVTNREHQATMQPPAPHCNKIYVSIMGGVVRLAFAEQFGDGHEPVFRSAVTVQIPDFLQLKDLVNNISEQVEAMQRPVN